MHRRVRTGVAVDYGVTLGKSGKPFRLDYTGGLLAGATKILPAHGVAQPAPFS
jgi:hypothetical protein